MRLLDYKNLIGAAILLKIKLVRLEDCVEIEKTFPNPGEAINFKKKYFSVAKRSVQKRVWSVNRRFHIWGAIKTFFL